MYDLFYYSLPGSTLEGLEGCLRAHRLDAYLDSRSPPLLRPESGKYANISVGKAFPELDDFEGRVVLHLRINTERLVKSNPPANSACSEIASQIAQVRENKQDLIEEMRAGEGFEDEILAAESGLKAQREQLEFEFAEMNKCKVALRTKIQANTAKVQNSEREVQALLSGDAESIPAASLRESMSLQAEKILLQQSAGKIQEEYERLQERLSTVRYNQRVMQNNMREVQERLRICTRELAHLQRNEELLLQKQRETIEFHQEHHLLEPLQFNLARDVVINPEEFIEVSDSTPGDLLLVGLTVPPAWEARVATIIGATPRLAPVAPSALVDENKNPKRRYEEANDAQPLDTSTQKDSSVESPRLPEQKRQATLTELWRLQHAHRLTQIEGAAAGQGVLTIDLPAMANLNN